MAESFDLLRTLKQKNEKGRLKIHPKAADIAFESQQASFYVFWKPSGCPNKGKRSERSCASLSRPTVGLWLVFIFILLYTQYAQFGFSHNNKHTTLVTVTGSSRNSTHQQTCRLPWFNANRCESINPGRGVLSHPKTSDRPEA